ncbi:MAG: hypothetical protein HZC55_18910 [Verrucomicrobia bacterium]|nr:hypothetical protein [Verrucomicrobiota bacterium]
MPHRFQSRASRIRRHQGDPRAGFSLVAASVALFALSLAAAAGLPWWRDRQRAAQVAATAADLRAFAEAFQKFAHDRGDWPPDAGAPAEVPTGMTERVERARWQAPSPIGGHYAWAPYTLQRGERYRAALLILSVGREQVSPDRTLLAALDQQLDDGNLDTGRFRLGFRQQPVLVLEH